MTTTNSDVIIYNTLAQTAYLERIQDVLNIFNASSGGTIQLVNDAIMGDFAKDTFYKIGGEVGHRDVDDTSDAAAGKVGMGERVGVKTPWKYGPYETTEEAFKRRGRSVEEFAMLVGQDAADAALAYFIQAGFASLDAAVSTNTSMVVPASIATDGKKALTKGMRSFGDKASLIGIFAMDSATYFDLVDNAIDEKIFNEASVVVYGGQPGTLGKPVLVSDRIPANKIYGLQAGALKITESQAPGMRIYDVNGKTNLTKGYQAEGVFNVDVLGYSFKETAGANPDLATLGASANWAQYVVSNKATAGVIIDLSDTGA